MEFLKKLFSKKPVETKQMYDAEEMDKYLASLDEELRHYKENNQLLWEEITRLYQEDDREGFEDLEKRLGIH